ncbi:MAG: peroxiredoxin family protein, partial [Planctomycetota bacterium]|nr:peroxiredoxin family protein [Planctomycetota bacterium]
MSNQVEQVSQSTPEVSAIETPATAPQEREWGTRVFLGFLFLIACGYATMLIYHVSRPPGTVAEDAGILEQCRQICLRYGLVSTGNVRKDAEAYLQVVQKQQLTEGLSQILSEHTFRPTPSQEHPLLNQTAPDFSLPDDAGRLQSLSQLAKNRPVVIVFYLGYGCSHCVAQLIAIDRDLHYFRELDADVVAISADESTHTAERFQVYGRFHFPVLADIDNAVGRAWGVYHPKKNEQPEFSRH